MILICRRGDGEGGTTEYLPAPEVSHGAAYLCPLKENMELKKNFDFYSAWQTHCLKKKIGWDRAVVLEQRKVTLNCMKKVNINKGVVL